MSKQYLYNFLLFVSLQAMLLAGCGQGQKSKQSTGNDSLEEQRMELTDPKGEQIEYTYEYEKGVLTVILLTDKEWFVYNDTSISKGRTYDQTKFKALLKEMSKQMGDSLMVVIKPTSHSSAKAATDVLDALTRNGIKNYAMFALTPYEEKRFAVENFDFAPPEPVEINTPKSVTTQSLPEDNAFVIEIRADETVWYQPVSKTSRFAPQQVKAPISTNLAKIISDFAAGNSEKKITYVIKGHAKSTYPVFEEVVKALKSNNIYKYKLLTSE